MCGSQSHLCFESSQEERLHDPLGVRDAVGLVLGAPLCPRLAVAAPREQREHLLQLKVELKGVKTIQLRWIEVVIHPLTCSFLLANMSGMTNTSSDMSSMRLFCRGVPVSSSFLRGTVSNSEMIQNPLRENETICLCYLDARTRIRFS